MSHRLFRKKEEKEYFKPNYQGMLQLQNPKFLSTESSHLETLVVQSSDYCRLHMLSKYA